MAAPYLAPALRRAADEIGEKLGDYITEITHRLNATPPRGDHPMSELPQTLWFGMIQGQWPVRVFSVEGHATDWLEETGTDGDGRRQLWRADLTNVTELELVPPVPAALREVVNDSVASPTQAAHHPI